jgi:transcriptional regulator of acetoin/glycerol metabolism
METLLSYRWPGNVRELENLCEKVALFAERSIVRPSDLVPLGGAGWAAAPRVETLEEMEKRHIREVLELTRRNFKQAARLLGIPRSTLYRKVRRFGLGEAPPEARSGSGGDILAAADAED